MTVVHVKSNTIADMTGTVTVHNASSATTTVAATNLVRPTDWNSAHQYTQTISGNTAGTSTAGGTNYVFGATGGASLSHSTEVGANTIWVRGAVPNQYWVVNDGNIQSQVGGFNLSQSDGSLRMQCMPFSVVGNGTFNQIAWLGSRAATGVNSFTMRYAIYSYSNATRLDLIGSTENVYVNSDTASCSGIRLYVGNLGGAMTALTPGQYVMGFWATAGSTSALNISVMGRSANAVNTTYVMPGSNSYQADASNAPWVGQGMYSATTSQVPASIPLSGMANARHGFPNIYFTLRATA